MARKKKESSEVIRSVAKEKKINVATLSCPHCKSESFKKVKATDIGALYSCGCGNRFQA